MADRQILHLDTTFTLEVDDEDMDILVKSWWVCFKAKNSKYCKARRNLRKHEKVEGRGSKVSLHNEVWEKHFGPVPEGHEIDHVDYNTLNNRKSNLRLLTKKENNGRNRKPRSPKNVEQMVEAA